MYSNLSSNLNTTVQCYHSIFSVMKNITHAGKKCLTYLKIQLIQHILWFYHKQNLVSKLKYGILFIWLSKNET